MTQIIGSKIDGYAVERNKVLRSTYMLLSMTLLFSAGAAWFAMATNMTHFGFLVTIGGYFGLLFLTTWLRNSAWGILAVFGLTGFMGLTLGPMLNHYIHAFSNGAELVMMALGGTGLIFAAMSGYALMTKKDFSFMSGFLFVGVWVAFFAGLAAIFFEIPALSLAVSAIFVLLMSGMILFETSNIINGGETNYIMATVSLYVSLFNLFVSLLDILGALNGRD